MRAEIDTPYL